AEDDGPLARQQAGGEPRDGRRVLALRILPRAVDVEEPQRDARQAIGPRVRLRIELAGDLLRRVRAGRPWLETLMFGLLRPAAVRRARAGQHHALDPGAPGGLQHVDRPA